MGVCGGARRRTSSGGMNGYGGLGASIGAVRSLKGTKKRQPRGGGGGLFSGYGHETEAEATRLHPLIHAARLGVESGSPSTLGRPEAGSRAEATAASLQAAEAALRGVQQERPERPDGFAKGCCRRTGWRARPHFSSDAWPRSGTTSGRAAPPEIPGRSWEVTGEVGWGSISGSDWESRRDQARS